jgi:hypothetical protein
VLTSAVDKSNECRTGRRLARLRSAAKPANSSALHRLFLWPLAIGYCSVGATTRDRAFPPAAERCIVGAKTRDRVFLPAAEPACSAPAQGNLGAGALAVEVKHHAVLSVPCRSVTMEFQALRILRTNVEASGLVALTPTP